jgi:hypothetical protein
MMLRRIHHKRAGRQTSESNQSDVAAKKKETEIVIRTLVTAN